MAFLIGMSESVRGQRYELKNDRTTIGRSSGNDIVISDGAASAQHCYISRRGGRFVLHDMNSTNGTCLNFERVTEAELKHKQVIQIGSSEFMFNDDNPVNGKSETNYSINTKVVEDVAPPVINPKSFSSVSPFGARPRENKGVWMAVIALVAILALAGLVFFITQLLK
ncbi:MAG: FHA domain-containing protein [Kiritimatiellia bacterium]